jgi:hypothetical protein
MVDYYKLLRLEKQKALIQLRSASVSLEQQDSSQQIKTSQLNNHDRYEKMIHSEYLKIKTKTKTNEKFTLERHSPFQVLQCHFRVGTILNLYYVPNYITDTEEALILQQVCFFLLYLLCEFESTERERETDVCCGGLLSDFS